MVKKLDVVDLKAVSLVEFPRHEEKFLCTAAKRRNLAVLARLMATMLVPATKEVEFVSLYHGKEMQGTGAGWEN